MAGKVVDVTLKLIDQITSPLNGINKNLANSGRQWVKAGRQIQNAGKSISSVGKTLTTSLTLPIVGAGTACIKLATDFEAGMSKVQSISGATAIELDALSEKAKEMGAKTKYSATEATEAFSYMAMAGWDVQEMIAGIEGVMYLAGATGEDLALTSDIVTDALTAFGMTASDTTQFVDVLAKTANSSNTSVAMLGESFQYVAPVAGALKYNVQDVSTALGLMANSGVKASTAGTALRSWMSRMSAPTDAVQSAMNKLGISLTDSEGNMKTFASVMKDTRFAFNRLTEAEKSQYASVLAGKQGMSGLLAIVNSAESDFNVLSDAVYNSTGACKEMYDVANDNLQGQLTILKSTIESLAISFGELLTPYVKDLVSHVQTLAEKFNALSDSQKQTVLKVSAIVASIGPATLIFGKIVTAIGVVVTTFGKFGVALKSAGSIGALFTGPVGIVIGVVSLLATAVFAIVKNWSKIKPFLQNVKQWFIDSFGGAGGAFEKFKQAFQNIVSAISPIVSAIASWFKDMIPKGIGALKNAIDKIAPVLEKFFINDVNMHADVMLKLSEGFKKAVPVVVDFVKNGIEKVRPILQLMVKAIKEAIPFIRDTLVKAFQIVKPTIQTVVNVVRQIVSVVGQNLVKAFNAVKPVLASFKELFHSIFGEGSGGSGSVLRDFYEKAKPVIQNIVSALLWIVEKVQPAFQLGFQLIGDTIINLANTVTTIFTGIMGVLNGLITFITGVFTGNWSKAWEGVKTVFSSIFSTFASLAKQPINAVISVINGAISALNRVKVNIPDWVPSIGGNSFSLNIPTIPTLAVGTDNWKGGLVQISEKGGEIVDLPSGSRVYPHDESVQKAYSDGAKIGSGQSVTVNIPKLADTIVVREEADIDKIASKFADKLEEVSHNLGGGELGYIY